MPGFPVDAVEVHTQPLFRIPWGPLKTGQSQSDFQDAYRATLATMGFVQAGSSDSFTFAALESPWLPYLLHASGTLQGGHKTVPTRWYTEVRRGEWWTVRTGPDTVLTDQGAVYGSLVACPPETEAQFTAMYLDPSKGLDTAAAFATCTSLTSLIPERLAVAEHPQKAWAEVAATLTLITQDARSVRVLARTKDAAETQWLETPTYAGPSVKQNRLEALLEVELPDERRFISEMWFESDPGKGTWQLDSGSVVGRTPFERD